MIDVDYVCGFANRLFQFSIANIIAKHHGLMFSASPIDGFPRSFTAVEGSRIEGEHELIESPADVLKLFELDTLTRPLLLRGLFQYSGLYLNSLADIRENWLILDSTIQSADYAAECDLIVHVRRGDYLLHNWGAPFSYYQEAIESSGFHKICIITDDPNDPFLARFHRYRPIIVSSHYLSDFVCLTTAKKIVMSPSTFSWWGAFLSEAEEIYFPIPFNGIWSLGYREDVDLTLPSSFRQYNYIRCTEPLKLNAAERLYFEAKYLNFKLQAQGYAGYIKGHAKSIIKLSRQLFR